MFRRRPVTCSVLSQARMAAALLGALSPTSQRLAAQAYTLLDVTGPGTANLFGFSVEALGDLNADGVGDFLVGAPNAGSVGQARVLSGSAGTTLLTLFGPSPGSGFGWSVSGTGDVNGDGIADFVVGALYAGTGGQARIFSGATGATVSTFNAPASGSQFGASVDGGADIDGDGVPDLVVGGYTAPGGGQALAFSGPGGPALFTATGSTPGAQFGFSVAFVGDVDGDGKSDVLVGAPGASQASLLSAANGSLLLSLAGGAGESFGASVSGAGDVNSDGVPDLVVGAILADPGGLTDAGQARIFSGAAGGVLYTLNGTAAFDRFGSSVADVGDVDGDGIGDIAIGAPERNAGPGLVDAGRVHVFSGSSGATLYTNDGSVADGNLGQAVAPAGDLNGDGLADVLAGAPGFVLSTSPGGSIRVLSLTGIPVGSTPFGAGCPGSGGITPVISTAGGVPSPGNAGFRVYVSKALGGSAAVLVLGVSDASWGGIPLPVDLGFVGMPGCSLLVAANFLYSAVASGTGPGSGAAWVPLPIPADAALSGGSFYVEWLVGDPGPSLLPGVMTRAIHLVVP